MPRSSAKAGHAFPFRCGRATGFSYLETPQLVFGDTTVLQAGMVLAVDGSVTVPGHFRSQVGDSIIVTEDGYEPLTWLSKELDDVILDRRATQSRRWRCGRAETPDT